MADIDAPLAWRMQQDGYLMQINQLRDEKTARDRALLKACNLISDVMGTCPRDHFGFDADVTCEADCHDDYAGCWVAYFLGERFGDKVRRCPFCGYESPEVYHHSNGILSAWVYCPECDAQGPHEALTDDLEKAAIEAWNDRRFA